MLRLTSANVMGRGSFRSPELFCTHCKSRVYLVLLIIFHQDCNSVAIHPSNIQFLKCKLSIQAISKVKAAIKGYKNTRLEDLSMMTSKFVKCLNKSYNFLTGFTHTGGVENLFSLQGKYATKQIFFRCKAGAGQVHSLI